MFFTRTGLTKVLGLAVLGTAGLFTANSAQASGFRFYLGVAPVVYAQPAVVVQQPTCPTPVYTPVYATPVQQQVIVAPAPVCAPPVVVYDRDGWHHDRHEFFDRHDRRFWH